MPFYTPPPDLPLDDLAERIAARVVDMYADIESELLGLIAYRFQRDLPEVPDLAERLSVVRELQARARALLRTIPDDIAAQILQIAIERGTAAAARELRLTEGMAAAGSITSTAASTLAMVAADLGNAFDQAHLRILRYPIDAVGQFIGTDVYQQTIAEHVGMVTVGGVPVDVARQRALATLLERGVTGFTDRLGREWRIGSYTEMATRTATARAFNEAKNDRMLRNGIRMVSILGNNDACRLCGPWFGKVLSIDGTPAGRYWVEHTTRPGEYVEVVIAARLEDARAQGLMHPNCACTTASYFPGLSVATSATHFDAEAAAGRDRQRELERETRAAKRKLEVSHGLGDSEAAGKAHRQVLSLQRDLRSLTAQTGQRRKYSREQPRFADGVSRQVSVRQRMLGLVPDAVRVAPFVPDGLDLRPHELSTANRLANVGLDVRFREVDHGYRVKNLDVEIDGDVWEFKSPQGAGGSTITNQLRRAKEQGARRVVIDLARTTLPADDVLDELRRRFARNEWLLELILIDQNQTVTRLQHP